MRDVQRGQRETRNEKPLCYERLPPATGSLII